jgi:hypothetical protein
VEQRVYDISDAQLFASDDIVKGQKLPVFMHATLVTGSASDTPHLARSIATPDNQLAPSLFFHYFSVEDTDSGHALTSCLPEMISQAEDDALSAAVSSVGYALLSKMPHSSDKLIMARKKYGLAVRNTCSILQTYVASETCWVIRVILILALFEVSG